MARSISEVIDKVLGEVPSSYVGTREELKSIKNNSGYAAPEMEHLLWPKLVDTLDANLPSPDEPNAPKWCGRIKEIMAGRGVN